MARPGYAHSYTDKKRLLWQTWKETGQEDVILWTDAEYEGQGGSIGSTACLASSKAPLPPKESLHRLSARALPP